MKYFKYLAVVVLVVILSGASLLFVRPGTTHAVSGSDFNAGLIIDNSVFFNKNTMNTGDIQNFLNAEEPTCQSGYTCLNNYSLTFTSIAADAYCGAVTGGNKSAADVIFDMAQACNINPEVLIVLLQKEQGLVASTAPTAYQYQFATGFCVYDDPSTEPAACQGTDGFSNQVYYAAHQFDKYGANPSGYTYSGGQSSYVAYNPSGACGGSTVGIQNQATADLYNYTPYQPDQAALNNLYGTGDSCSSYGNRNFWRDFNDWFGPTTGSGYILADDATCVSACSQYVIYGSIKQYVSGAAKAAWNLPDQPEPMAPSILNTFTTAVPLAQLGILAGTPNVYFMDGGQRYYVNNASYNAWNFQSVAISTVPPALFNLTSDAGALSYVVKNPTSSTYYMVDGANGAGQTVLRPYANSTVQQAWEGNLNYVPISSNYFSVIDNAIGSTISTTSASCEGTNFQVVNGGMYTQSSAIGALFPTTQSVSAATFNRLTQLGSMTDLIQSPDSPTVYLMDGGTKRQILWPNALNAWSAGGQGITQVNDQFLSTLPTGTSIGSYLAIDGGGNYYVIDDGMKIPIPSSLHTAYGANLSSVSVSANLMSLFPTVASATAFIQGRATPSGYLLDSSGNLRHLPNPTIARLWGTYQTGITYLSDYIVNSLPTAASPQAFVNDGTTDYLVENGTKHPISGSTLTDWGLSSPQVYSDGTLSMLPTSAAMTSQLQDNGDYYYIKEGNAFLTVDPKIAGVWNITNAPQLDEGLVTTLLPINELARFVNSTTSSQTYMVDQGQWYSVSAAQLANLGGVGAPTMALNPADAPNTITAWTSVVVQDHTGKDYVIDGGNKDSFNNPIIQNSWTNNGALTVPTMSNGFLDLLPTNSGGIQRAIQGSGPAVYAVMDGTAYHIVNSTTYQLDWAPYSSVSQALVNAMPSGSNID